MDPTDMPVDPVTQLAAGVTQLHEVYMSYLYAGFTPHQSMILVCEVLRASFGRG